MSTKDVYGKKENPYQSWLETTSEKYLLEQWLKNNLCRFILTGIHDRPTKVVDIGCGEGSTSLRLIRSLEREHLIVEHFGIDEYPEQLARCERLLMKETRKSVVAIKQGSVDTFQMGTPVDLVFASHCLYYASDLRAVLGQIIVSGHEAILVHHGARGINSLHERFKQHVSPGRHVVSTDADVAAGLEYWRGQNAFARSEHHRFTSEVDVSSCMDPRSKRGQNLISFFLERKYEDIPRAVTASVRQFIRQNYAPLGYQMPHDVGIFYISHK